MVSVDLFAIRKTAESAADVIAPLDGGKAAVGFGEPVTVDVVVANRGVGHSFPAELRDIFEAWLEFQATDANGRVLAHSGAVSEDGTLEWDAHAYRALPISDEAQPIVNHDIWNTRATALDRQLAAGRADLARFTFSVPPNARSPITLSAKLNYRRFNNRFMDFVASDIKVGRSPVVEMAAASVSVQILESPDSAALARRLSTSAIAGASAREAVRLRWRAYGVALFDQQQYEAAVQAFEQAVKLAATGSPEEASSRIDLAMTCLRMERAGSSQPVIDQAAKSLARALEIAPDDGRGRYYRALLNIKRFRSGEAVSELEALGRKYPRDRQVWSQLASIYLLQWRDAEARLAYEHVIEIDPDDTEAHLKLASLYWRFGLIEMAKREQDAYQARHIDTVAETMRRSYLRAHPELYATWPWREFGDNPIGSMP